MLLPSIFNNTLENSLLDDFFQTPAWDFDTLPRTMGAKGSAMSADIKEYDDRYQMELSLPGYQKENIQAHLEDGYLTINASHTENKDEKDDKGKYIRRERYMGSCSRSFYVGTDVTEEDIKAKFENGILTVEIPKKEAKPEVDTKKYISIEG